MTGTLADATRRQEDDDISSSTAAATRDDHKRRKKGTGLRERETIDIGDLTKMQPFSSSTQRISAAMRHSPMTLPPSTVDAHHYQKPLQPDTNSKPADHAPQNNTNDSYQSLSQHPRSTAELSILGFGVESGHNCTTRDATIAALRAVQDATSRLVPNSSSSEEPRPIRIVLGVPPKHRKENGNHTTETMPLELQQIFSILPKSVTVQSLDIHVGGLWVPASSKGATSMCTVVACISFANQHEGVVNTQPWAPMMGEKPLSQPPCIATSTNSSKTIKPQERERYSELNQKNGNSSIDLLARISEEVREQTLIQQKKQQRQLDQHDTAVQPSPAPHGFYRSYARQDHDPAVRQVSILLSSSMSSSAEENDDITNKMNVNEQQAAIPTVSPYGVSTKHMVADLPNFPAPSFAHPDLDQTDAKVVAGPSHNNPPLDQASSYVDNAQEEPASTEQKMILSGTIGNAFPLKLHQILSQIDLNDEEDASIVSWQPHGRAFKIHKPQEFSDIILPKYFGGTSKKSSVLRQLNLYGFTRLSGEGPDKNAYYHERFLRSKLFLCFRISRNKVNGKGTRRTAAGNIEPNFYQDFSSLPPSILHPSSLVGLEDASNESTSAIVSSSHQQPSFPLKLQAMLDKLEQEEMHQDIVSWLPHGRAFLVHRPTLFVHELMPQYFRQTKYSSFQRQLHMYSFSRITEGRDKGAYYHPHFLRSAPSLTRRMQRTRINGKGCRKPSDPGQDPDFYQQEYMPTMSKTDDAMDTAATNATSSAITTSIVQTDQS